MIQRMWAINPGKNARSFFAFQVKGFESFENEKIHVTEYVMFRVK